MRSRQITLQDVLQAVEQSNLNVAARSSRKTAWNSWCAGWASSKSIAIWENVVLKESGGTPVYLRDVATIQLGGDFRRGALDVDGKEVSGASSSLRNGENGLAVIKQVKAKIAQLTPACPPASASSRSTTGARSSSGRSGL